MAFYKQREI